MKGAANEWEVKSEDAPIAPLPCAVPSYESEVRMVDDIASPPPVTDAELEVLERYLRDLVHQVLFDEKPKTTEFRQPRSALRPGIDRPAG